MATVGVKGLTLDHGCCLVLPWPVFHLTVCLSVRLLPNLSQYSVSDEQRLLTTLLAGRSTGNCDAQQLQGVFDVSDDDETTHFCDGLLREVTSQLTRSPASSV